MAVLCPCRGWAADQWVEAGSQHFTVVTNAGEEQARHILGQLERMRWAFRELIPQVNADPAVPIEVVAAKDEKTFTAMEPARYLARGSTKLSGYFLRTSDRNYALICLDSGAEQPYAPIYHEYPYVEFGAAVGWMPMWLEEGTAEFFGGTEIKGDTIKLGKANSAKIDYLRQQELIPLKVLLDADRSSPYAHDALKEAAFYAESWALTHYLMMTDRMHHTHRVDDYLELIRNHEDSFTAAEKAFGDLQRLEATVRAYIQRGSYQELVLNSADAPIDESTFQSRVLTAGEADAARADVLAQVGRTDEARALAESVLQADPDNVQAQETMGLLEYRAGHMGEARKRYGEAVQLGSKDCLAYYYLALISMREGDGGDGKIESELRTAIRLNPQFAPAYDRLAAYYAQKRENLEEAHHLNLEAVELDPANAVYRLNASDVLVEMERYDDALAVLKEALTAAASPSQAATIEDRIKMAEQLKGGEEATVGVLAQAEKQPAARPGAADFVPAHPTVAATGPTHSFEGVIRAVTCAAGRGIEFRVEDGGGRSVHVYNNDFTSIDVTVAAALASGGTVFPCTQFEGKRALVEYVDSPDKTVDGQVTAVALEK